MVNTFSEMSLLKYFVTNKEDGRGQKKNQPQWFKILIP